MKIGLAFPEIGAHTREDFVHEIRQAETELDLLVFPERFEIVRLPAEAEPGYIADRPPLVALRSNYRRTAETLGLSIIVGVSVAYEDILVRSKADMDQYCLFVDGKGQSVLYHKHSTSKFNAFFDQRWSIERNFPVIEVDGAQVGLSVCHDSYISLIPRVLREKGAGIWVNISHQNVPRRKWEGVLQARAAENSMLSVCTLHRDEGSRNRQKEPYAFSPEGKIRLKHLRTEVGLDDIEISARTGKVFYFDTNRYDLYPAPGLKEGKLPEKAKRLSLQPGGKHGIALQPDDGNFTIERLEVEDFISSPERIWKLALKSRQSVPIFVISLDDNAWEEHHRRIEQVAYARVVEFSTAFIFLNAAHAEVFMGAYQSSNYKYPRFFFRHKLPIHIDRRYLRGLRSTYDISSDDGRGRSKTLYFSRINKMIQFLEQAH